MVLKEPQKSFKKTDQFKRFFDEFVCNGTLVLLDLATQQVIILCVKRNGRYRFYDRFFAIVVVVFFND